MRLNSMMIGTLFEEEEITKKKHFYNIEARDDKGKKHFHGSFTGGFSAGYKGTCGSKEGWAPSTFVSSRNQRNKGVQQTIQDYMDEEDLGATVAGETITAREEYDTLGDRQKQQLQKGLGKSILGSAPEELLVTPKTSIGYEILRNMGGFKKNLAPPAKKETKKVYGVQMPSPFSTKKKEEFTDFDEMEEFSTEIPKANSQFFGLNYHQANFEEDEYEAVFNKIFKKHANMEQPEEEEKSKASNRMSMKISDFDNDDDEGPLGDDIVSRFIVDEDDHIDDKLLKNAKIKKANKNTLLEFEKDSEPYRVDQKKSEPEQIPKDWDPFKKVKEHLSKNPGGSGVLKSQRYQEMNPQKRAAMLGEDADILEQKLASISEETKKKIMSVKTFVRGESQTLGGDDLNLIFHGDKEKIERYKMFCWEKMGKLVSGIPPGNMSYEAMKKEKEEFEKIYEMQMKERSHQEETLVQKPMTEEERKQAEILQKIDELKKNIQKERGRRKIEYWLPDRILCRRFNVPQPKTEKRVQQDNERQDKFYEEILPAFLGNKGKEIAREARTQVEVRPEDMPVKEFKSNKLERDQAFQQSKAEEAEEEEAEAEEEEIVEEERPPLELFQSIFGDEDEK